MKSQVSMQVGSLSSPVVGGEVVNRIHQITAPVGLGLDVGHVVIIDETGVTERWDGTPPADFTKTLGIVVAKQFDNDASVRVLRAGSYRRNRVVIADDSALSFSNEFVLTICGLYAEGEWI